MMKTILMILTGSFMISAAHAQFWNRHAYVGGDGVMEIGRYIDFHQTENGLEDFSLRLFVSDDRLISSGAMSMPGLHVYGNSASATNLILSANYDNTYRWKFKTINRGSAVDLDVVGTNQADQEEQVLKLSPSFSGRPELSVMNDWFTVNDGKIGIGTANPLTGLQLGSIGTEVAAKQITIPGLYNFERIKLGQAGNGNSELEFVNHSGVNTSYGMKLTTNVDNGGYGLQFQYARIENSYDALKYQTGMILGITGNVGIGTTAPSEKLTVSGKIKASEIRVDGAGAPDYVFEEGYKVETLEALESYIKANKHLPEIPSAKEFERDGIAVGEMNKLLLKKIEELTLHLIEKDKQVSSLMNRVDVLEKKAKK